MSGRYTVALEALEEKATFGRAETREVPAEWWLELCTTVATDELAGTAWGAGRAKIRNNEYKFTKERPRITASGIWTPKTSTEKIVKSFEVWDAQTDGVRWFIGMFYDLETEERIDVTIPAGMGAFFPIGRFKVWMD